MVMQRNYQLRFSLLFLLFAVFTFAQVGIGTPNPDASAILHVNAKNKGVLLPSIALTSDTDAVTVPSPADGLIVWNNGKAGLSEAGFYYWFASKWYRLSTSSNTTGKADSGTAWNTTGDNTGTYSAANTALSLGTKTMDDLIFKVNAATAGRLGVDNSVSLVWELMPVRTELPLEARVLHFRGSLSVVRQPFLQMMDWQ